MGLRSVPIFMLTILAGAFWASAASANMEDIVTCSNISRDAARLACYDAAARGIRAELTVQDEEERTELAQERDGRSFFGLPSFSLPNVLRRRETTPDDFGSADLEQRAALEADTIDELEEENAVLDEITAVVAEWGYNNRGRVFVVLENGHIWRQTENRRLALRRRGGNTVVINRTVFGAYTMRANGGRSFKVERTR